MKEQNNEQLEAPASPIRSYSRNEMGLINSITHTFNEDGSVNWRSMIKPEFLYPNKDWFDLRKKPIPESIEGLKDNQLLIMLGGIKEIAKLRGFSGVQYEVTHVNENHVVAKCHIDWVPNFETAGKYSIVYQDVANATLANTDDFCAKFLETIACNRAFVRCVRNFLNIHIVGADEIDKSKNRVADIAELIVSNALPITPQGTLEKAANEKLRIQNFDEFKSFLRSLWKNAVESKDDETIKLFEEAKEWKAFKDVPAKTSRVLLKLINEHQKNTKPN